MLQIMHDKIQGLVAGVVAVIIALAFSLWGVQNYLQRGSAHAVAKVNGKEITKDQLQAAYDRAKREIMQRGGLDFSLDQKGQAALKKEVLQQLIEQEVLLQASAKMGLGIGKRQLWEIITSMPAFQVDGKFSLNSFRQLTQKMAYSGQDFLMQMEHMLLRAQLERGIISSAFVLPNEIDFVKNSAKQRRDFSYFAISPERFLSKIKIDADTVKKYYDQYQSDFLLPEKISVQYLELFSKSIPVKEPTVEQLRQFYESHLDAFSTPKKWQVTKVLLPLSPQLDAKEVAAAKKKIEDIAIEFKDKKDFTNKDSLKVTTVWITYRDIPQDLAASLDKLEVGQLSAAMRVTEGYVVFKMLAKEPAKALPYADVATKVKELCKHQQLTQAFSEISDKLSDLVYTNPDSLEPAASGVGLKIKETGLVTRDGHKDGILTNNKLAAAAFSDVVLRQRYNSGLIEIEPGKMVVLRIKDYLPEKLQPLNEVQNTIMEKLQHEEAQKKAYDFAEELLAALNSGKSDSWLASEHSLVWHKVSGAKYATSREGNKLIEQAFSLTKPQGQKISALITNIGNESVVLRLDRVYDDNSDKENMKLGNLGKFLPEVFGAVDYQTLVNVCMKQAKIEIIDKVDDEKSHAYE